MGFADIIGQKRAIKALRTAYQQDRIPNAYLFAGPEGVGKYTTALILARLLNCQGVRQEIDSCDICSSCRKISQNNHIDIYTVAPAPSIIKISQIRDLHRILRFPPQEANMRTIIIDGVEKMNSEATNAFLKILEEPPPQNLFILVSSNFNSLLPTIISRCQKLFFAPIPQEELSAFLIEKHGFDPLHARLAAAISEGSVAKALQLQEDLLGQKRRHFLEQLPKLHEQPHGASKALSLAEELDKADDDIILYFDQTRIWLRDILVAKELPQPQPYLINQDLISLVIQHSRLLSTEKIHNLIRKIEQLQKNIRFHNASPRLSLENLFLAFGDPSYYG